jgi:hypothetical protein
MIPSLCIWHAKPDSGATRHHVSHPLWFTESAPFPSTEPQELAVGIRPIPLRAGFIGVAMVPPELDERVALNGTPLWSGMHGLRHGDRLEINGHNIWVAARTSVEAVAYDPAVHGQALICFLTRDRLAPGEAIVLCPGSNGKACNVIYKKQAWDLAMQATPRLRCTNCSFGPDDAEWEPPKDHVKRRIHDVLASVTNGRN